MQSISTGWHFVYLNDVWKLYIHFEVTFQNVSKNFQYTCQFNYKTDWHTDPCILMVRQQHIAQNAENNILPLLRVGYKFVYLFRFLFALNLHSVSLSFSYFKSFDMLLSAIFSGASSCKIELYSREKEQATQQSFMNCKSLFEY